MSWLPAWHETWLTAQNVIDSFKEKLKKVMFKVNINLHADKKKALLLN